MCEPPKSTCFTVGTVAGVSNQRVELRLLLIVPVLLALLGMHAFVAAPPGETGHAATTAAVGSSLVPELKRKGYDPASAASLIAASGTIVMTNDPA